MLVGTPTAGAVSVEDFRVMPGRWGRLALRHGVMLALAPLVPLIASAALVDLVSGSRLMLSSTLKSPLLPVASLVVALSFALVQRWSRSVAPTLDALRARAAGGPPEAVGALLCEESALRESLTQWSLGRALFVSALFAVALAFIAAAGPLQYRVSLDVLHRAGAHGAALPWALGLCLLFKIAVPSLVWAALGATGAWSMWATARFLHRLFSHPMSAVVLPQHPDDCGGYGFVGELCLLTAAPMLALGAFLALLGVVSALAHGAAGNAARRLLILGFCDGVLIGVITPLAFLCLFGPVWSLHKTLVQEREVHFETWALRDSTVRSAMWQSLERGDLKSAEAGDLQLRLLERVKPSVERFPVWPFSKQVLLKFGIPQIVSAAGLFGGSVGHLRAPATQLVTRLISGG